MNYDSIVLAALLAHNRSREKVAGICASWGLLLNAGKYQTTKSASIWASPGVR